MLPLQNFVDRVGPVVSAAWLNQVDIGLPRVVAKTVTTDRNTATPANDPELIVSVPSAGTYAYEVMFWTWADAPATQGISWGLNYSGTFNSSPLIWTDSSSGTVGGNISIASSPSGTSFGIGGSVGSTPFGFIIEMKGSLVATGVGTLGMQWFNSGAGITHVGLGSYMMLIRVL